MKVLVLGLGLTAVVAGLVWAGSDFGAGMAAAAFGGLATAIHLAAFLTLQRRWKAPFKELAVGWGIGMGLRLGGALIWLAAVLWDRVLFPPLPSAIGYLGVLIPLLFMEMRFLR